MKNNENILITLLVITAGILIAMLVGSWNAQNAYAESSSDRFGDYIMVTGARTDSIDLLYVIDVPNKKLLVYSADPVRGQGRFAVVDDRVNLATVFRTSSRSRNP